MALRMDNCISFNSFNVFLACLFSFALRIFSLIEPPVQYYCFGISIEECLWCPPYFYFACSINSFAYNHVFFLSLIIISFWLIFYHKLAKLSAGFFPFCKDLYSGFSFQGAFILTDTAAVTQFIHHIRFL
jgi:hypothetical protein